MTLYFVIVIGMIIASLLLNIYLNKQEETQMIKKAFWSNLVKAIELALVLVLGFLICFVASGLLYGNIYIGVAVIIIVFYYFGGMIRPYIKELQSKIIKEKLGDKE